MDKQNEYLTYEEFQSSRYISVKEGKSYNENSFDL